MTMDFCRLRGALLSAALLSAAGWSSAFAAPLELPVPDIAKAMDEDSNAKDGPYRYGLVVDAGSVQLSGSTNAGGEWELENDGMAIWQREIHAPGARSIDLHFSQLNLPKGASLHLVGKGKGNERIILAEELDTSGVFYSPLIEGDWLRLEVRVPQELRSQLQMTLSSATYGYRDWFAPQSRSKSGSCNVDVACIDGEGWNDQINSVGHYTFSRSGSGYVCTGTLIANTTRSTTPYFLTANHCLSTQTVANTVVVYWNYQNRTCRTPGSSASGVSISRSTASHSQSGATLIANNAASDFALLRLNTNVPSGANAYFSGWDISTTAPSWTVGIHHPAGHEKRVAIDNDPATISAYLSGTGTGTTHWRIGSWNEGTTEGGSSGSGLWNQNKLLIGQLHGGYASCNARDQADWYGRLSVSWTGGGTSATRLRDHLSPNSSATSQTGYPASGGGSGGGTPSAVLRFDTVDGPTTKSLARNSETPVTFAWRTQNLPAGTTCQILRKPDDSYGAKVTPVASGTRTDTAIHKWSVGTRSLYLSCSNGTKSPDIQLTITNAVPKATLRFDSMTGPQSKAIVRNSGTPIVFAWEARDMPNGTSCRIMRRPDNSYGANASPIRSGTRRDTKIHTWGSRAHVMYLRCTGRGLSTPIVSSDITLLIVPTQAQLPTLELRFDSISGPTMKTVARNSGAPVKFAWQTRNLPAGTTCHVLRRPNDDRIVAASPIASGSATNTSAHSWAAGDRKMYLSCSNGMTSPDITLRIVN